MSKRNLNGASDRAEINVTQAHMIKDYADYDTTMPSHFFPEGDEEPVKSSSKFRIILIVLVCVFLGLLALFLV